MEVNNNLSKIKLILQYVIEGKIVMSENCTEKLLKFLDDHNENSAGKLILDTPCFSDLVFNSIVNINNTSTSTQVFLLQLVTTLFKHELQFNKMQMQGFTESFNKFSNLHNLRNNPPPSLHLPYIELATVHSSHFSGLKVIIPIEVWKYILQPNIHHKPKNISKAAYNFVAKLVLKLDEYDLETELIKVLEHVVKPIFDSEYLQLPAIDNETDDVLCDKIFPYVSALVAIFNEANNVASNNKIISLLMEYFHLDHILYKIYIITKNEELLKLLNGCWLPMNFAMLQHLLRDKKIDAFCNRMAIAHRNYLVLALNKRNAFIVVDYILQSGIIWSNIEKSQSIQCDFPLTFERYGHKKELSLQIVVHLIVPIIKYAKMYHISKNIEIKDVIEPFLVKICKTITEYIYSCIYTFSSLLEENGLSYIRQVAIKTLIELLRLKEHLNESQAGPIFQSLYYSLGVFILCDEAGGLVVNENTIDQEDLRLLSHLLNAMKMLLNKYTISWYENVEIVNVQADLLSLLTQNFLTAKQKVQTLDLLDICVKKFLSPNMTLLVESKNKQDEIGEVIKIYVQNEEWEVRDSAFNLLKTCTEISFIKYVPLQKVIKNYNLILIAAKAGLNETDFYPQCTALKCLAAATKISSIWQEVIFDNENIYLQLVTILRHHDEGLVRKEAAKVLTAVYVNQKIDRNLQNTLYEAMTMAALNDLNWEVQLVALNFWRKVINNHLTNRGMLDGKFPSMTFSKEKRKIIVMNDEEIKRQLIGVMNDLSKIGCLTVLVGCMNDIHNIDVMIQALSIAKDLVAILDKYKFEQGDIVRVKMEVMVSKYEVDHNMSVSNQNATSNEEERNKVIDSILSVNQTDLIVSLCDNYQQIKIEEMDTDESSYPCRELVHPNEFLETFRNTDFSLLIDNKKKFYAECAGPLSSLLDDILALKAID